MDFLNKLTKAELLTLLAVHGMDNPSLSRKKKEELIAITEQMLEDIAMMNAEDKYAEKAMQEAMKQLSSPNFPNIEKIDYEFKDEYNGHHVLLFVTENEAGQTYWKAVNQLTGKVVPATYEELMHLMMTGKISPYIREDDADKPKAAKDFNSKLINTSIEPTKLVRMLKTAIKKDPEEAITLLFHGTPGTGKTQLAKYIGDQMGLEVIRYNLSDLLSKYVGDTEQAIGKAFKEAEGKILHIDEFDSLANDRGDADRNYQVSHTNSLLQAIDDFKGILVVTTNYIDKIDSAILRRFLLKTEFFNLTDKQVKLAAKHFFPEMKLTLRGSKFAPADFALVKRSLIFVEDEKITEDYITERLFDEASHRTGESKTNTNPLSFLNGGK